MRFLIAAAVLLFAQGAHAGCNLEKAEHHWMMALLALDQNLATADKARRGLLWDEYDATYAAYWQCAWEKDQELKQASAPSATQAQK